MPAKNTLRVGCRGQEVSRFKRLLTQLGYTVSSADNGFDQNVVNSVIAFQRNYGLPATGDLDLRTQEVLEEAVEATRKPVQAVEPKLPDIPRIEPVIRPAPPRTAGVSVCVIASDETLDEVQRCISAVAVAIGSKPWRLIFTTTQESLSQHVDKLGLRSDVNVHHIHYTGSWVCGLNRALAFCRQSPEFHEIVYPVRACDIPMPGIFGQVLPIMVANRNLFAYGDWSSRDGTIRRASTDSAVMEAIPLGSVLINVSLLPPVPANAFPENIPGFADTATWLCWYYNDVKLTPIPGWLTCQIVRRPPPDGALEWAILRRSIYSANWTKPKVSALMVTGRCAERYPMARVAVKCFLDQTWPNKELVIINHGQENVLVAPDQRVKELRVVRAADDTLGDLRNWSIEAATGDWCIQWDDDDWHHPNRIASQMSVAKADHVVSLQWQVRYSMTDNCAFYDRMASGQQMTVLFDRSTPAKYEKLNVREDTAFMRSFGKRVVLIDNSVTNKLCDPMAYLRTFHGRNIWDYGHMMKGSDGKNAPTPNKLALTPYHCGLVQSIWSEYLAQPGFTVSLEHPGSPVPAESSPPEKD